MKQVLHIGPMLVAFLLVSPLAAGAVSPGVSGSEVIIGVTTALSGPAAAWGNTAVGMEAWAKYVNQQGGVHGRKLTVIVRDDGHHPDRAVLNVKQMNQTVFALVGLLGSAANFAVKDEIAEYKIPLINPYANPMIWANQRREKLRYVFVNHPDYADEGDFLVTYAATKLGARKIAVFFQNDEYGKGGLVGVRRGMKALAGKATLVSELSYEFGDRQMEIHALKLKDSGADTVLLYSTPVHAANVLKEMAKIAYRPKILSSFTLGDHVTMFRLLGQLWEGTYYNVIWAVQGEPEADRVIDILVKHEPRLIGKETFGLAGAIPLMILVEGLKRAGPNLSRETFIAAMETLVDFSPQNLTPPLTFGTGRRHGLNAVRLMRAEQATEKRIVPITGYQFFPPKF